MSIFSRYKRPISEITGIKTKPSAASILYRKNAEEMTAMYVEGTARNGQAALYVSYFDNSTRTNVSHIFFRGGALFGAWALGVIVQDLNAMAAKYNLKQRVMLVSDT